MISFCGTQNHKEIVVSVKDKSFTLSEKGVVIKMQKIINALKYGNTKTKCYIICIFLLFLCGGVSAILAGIKVSPLFAMVAIFSLLLGIILMSSVSFQGPVTTIKLSENKEVSSSKFKKNKIENVIKEDVDSEDDKEEAYLDNYNEKAVKKIFSYYKVKRDHVPIMLDSCKSENIRQCPAYAWLDKRYLHILLLEKEARKIEIPVKMVTRISYERGVLAHPEIDYANFSKPSFLSLVFSSLLPTVYEEGEGVRRLHRKNLYVIGNDIMVTNTSAKTVFDLLRLDLTLPEEEIYNKKYSPYFTAAYKLNIQLKDGALSVKDYKLRMKEVLQKLAEAEITEQDFSGYMKQLIQGRLITKEYADYYVEYRKKRTM